MILSQNIIRQLEKRCGHPIGAPAHCNALALDIESRTGEHIGVNTVKRLLGFIKDERQPRESTLHIIANYLGYDSWKTLKMIDEAQGNSDFNVEVEQVRPDSLQIGDLIEITYSPNRRVVIHYDGENNFTVKESVNGKLLPGDAITLSHIIDGYPLLVAKVVREGKDLGQFVAGKAQGVKFKILYRMDNSSFSNRQEVFPDAERLPVEGATCEGYRVKLYGKLHFLKRLKLEFRTNPRYVAAIKKEFETGYNLEHPHLVRYIASGDDYLLMEWVDGLTLDEFAKQNPDFFKNKANVNRLLGELLDALQYLHAHQIVHLDLKPENILITRVGNELKLTDLGFCYTDTYTDTMGRTDSYAAPEQLAGDGCVDQRTDIFAVGRIIATLPCAKSYRKVIERCTKHDKEERFPSAETVKKALSKRGGKWPLVTAIIAVTCLAALAIAWALNTKQPAKTTEAALPGDTVAQAEATTATTADTVATTVEGSNGTSPQPIISDKEPRATANEPAHAVTKPLNIDPETLRSELLEATQPIYDKYLKQYDNVSTIDADDKAFNNAQSVCQSEIARKLFRLWETKYKPMGVLESDYNPIASKVINHYKEKIDRKVVY